MSTARDLANFLIGVTPSDLPAQAERQHAPHDEAVAKIVQARLDDQIRLAEHSGLSVSRRRMMPLPRAQTKRPRCASTAALLEIWRDLNQAAVTSSACRPF